MAFLAAISMVITIITILIIRIYYIRIDAQLWKYPNRMARGQQWRYWAHRYGFLWSPSCEGTGIPYGDLKGGGAWGWVTCKECGWSSRLRRDTRNGEMNPKNWEQYSRHSRKHINVRRIE